MFPVSSCSCVRSIHWSQVLSWKWRCSWSSADRRCSNYIWVINNFIAYWGATYIRGFTVVSINTLPDMCVGDERPSWLNILQCVFWFSLHHARCHVGMSIIATIMASRTAFLWQSARKLCRVYKCKNQHINLHQKASNCNYIMELCYTVICK